MQQVSKEEIRGGPRFGGCQLWGASLTGERPLSGGRPAILRAALRTDAHRIADRYTWHAAWPPAAVFAACRPAPVVPKIPRLFLIVDRKSTRLNSSHLGISY